MSNTNVVRTGKAIGYIVFVAFLIAPIIWIIMMSLKDFSDVIAFPPKFAFTPTLENYESVLFSSDAAGSTGAGEFLRYLLNSFIVSGAAVVLSIVVGVPAAYALTRARVKAQESLAFAFLSIRFVPELAIIIPLYSLYQGLQMYDTFTGLILANQIITLPLVIWTVRTFISDVPVELEDAAQIDGCGPWRTMFSIITPIIRPGLASAAIVAFIFSWNNLIIGLVLSGKKTQPVTVGILQAIGFDQVRWGWMAAAAMVAAIPGMIIAIYLQKHLVRGLTMGIGK